MTKQELIKKYKTLSDEIFIKHFKFVARAKVARAKAQIELLKEIIADLEKLDQSKVASINNDLRNSFYTWQMR